MDPDSPRTGWVHPLPMLGGLEPVKQIVEPGEKQVHLGLVPPGTNGLEDLWVKGPFCLNGLA